MRPPRGVLRIKSSRVGPPRLIFTSNGLTSRASKGEARQLTGERAVEARSTLQSTVASNSVLRSSERHFYLWMAGVFVLMAFGGFTPTYWAPVASGTFHGPPILHIHGALLFSWTLFYFMQTAWIASGHTPTHRAWGLAGIALFSVMMRSEERRVGKECRSRWSPDQEKKRTEKHQTQTNRCRRTITDI